MLKVVAATETEMLAVMAVCTATVSKFKRGHNDWDGNVRLYWLIDGYWYVPAGCWQRIAKLAEPDPTTYRPAYEVKFRNPQDFFDYNTTFEEVSAFVDALNLGFADTTDQKTVLHSILLYRMSMHHIATGFGKTALCYMLAQYTKQVRDGKTLMIVPRVILVEQGIADCMAYMANCDTKLNVYGICGGWKNACSYADADLVIGTYQSLSNLPDDMFLDITTVICDEAHTAKALSVRDAVCKCKNASIVTGISGTMQYAEPVDKLNLESYVGPLILSYPAHNQIECGRLPRVAIQPVELVYDMQDAIAYKALCNAKRLPPLTPESVQELGSEYKLAEFEYLYTSNVLYNFILALASLHTKQGHNVLIIFKNRQPVINLFNMANERGMKCHMILGGTPFHVRNGIRQQIENETGWLLVATDGTMSMGVSINNLHAMILSLIGHSPHVTLQAIGRMLRNHKSKQNVTVCYDVHSNITAFGTRFDMTHYAKRKHYYDAEQYPVYETLHRNSTTYRQAVII